MVFKGITVEFVVGYTTVDMQDPDLFTRITYSMGSAAMGSMMNSQPQEPAWDIDIKVKFPDIGDSSIYLLLSSSKIKTDVYLFDFQVSKNEKSGSYYAMDRVSRSEFSDQRIFKAEVNGDEEKGFSVDIGGKLRMTNVVRPFELRVGLVTNDILLSGGDDVFKV